MPIRYAFFAFSARAILAPVLALFLGAASCASLPDGPRYKGELRGDGKGGVVVIPPAAPDERRDATDMQEAGRASQPDHRKTAAQHPPEAGPTTLKVGPNRAIRTIAQAAKTARSGDTILIEPGVYAGDVAVFTQERLTIRAVGGRARLEANGAHAEGKAIWVVRGGDILVENIEFIGARVPDRNGAGIRFEKGRLVLRNCLFSDNENGILTGTGGSALEIENSEFSNNGTRAGNGHQLYVGAIPRLRVTGSYFHNAVGGHLLKSRAAQNIVMYNRLTDEAGGHASYELEFPNGGVAYVVGNIIQQGPTTENSSIISVGAEGYRWPKNELYLVSNTIVDDRPANGIFLRIQPGMQRLKIMNNLLVGDRKHDIGLFSADQSTAGAEGKPVPASTLRTRLGNDLANGEASNNFTVGHDGFEQSARYDYRLRQRSRMAGKYKSPGTANDIDLAPHAEYVHPAQTRRLTAPPTVPGAMQSKAY
ncbi:MAG: hypothetical protein JWQ23_3070 [Herminiimonas sp.]|nr:hypothetical protein [Herminiimonas sp.]